MKPYGIKHKKSTLGIHDSDKCDCEVCNTKGWKISKKRQRTLIKTELQLVHEETDELVLSSDDG